MTERPLIGLLCALFVEGCHWIKLRWEFNESSYESAWQLSFVLMVLTAVMIWLGESRFEAVMMLMGWMPVILIPLQFVQGYGMRDLVQLTAFSLLARRSRLRIQRLGLIHKSVAFNFGNVTFTVTLLSASVAMNGESHFFLPGMLILCGWMLLATGRCRLSSMLPLLVVAGLLGLAGKSGLEQLEKWVRRGGGSAGPRFNPNYHATQLGQRGRVIQSPEILWRLTTESGEPPPRLLRTSTYGNFLGLNWQNQRFLFTPVESRFIEGDRHHLLVTDIGEGALVELPKVWLRGSVDEAFVLPMTASTASVVGCEDAEVQINEVGLVRIKPTASVIEAGLHIGSQNQVDGECREADQKIQPSDMQVMIRVASELDLASMPNLESKLARLKQWYVDEFRYTLDLTISQPPVYDRTKTYRQPSAMEQFLTDIRAGHCEYFATSAALILRAAGVHTRYAVGFGVMEKSKNENEYLIRGTHSHAWVRVWDEKNKHWIDFDPTPPDWMGGSASRVGWFQSGKDTIKRLREDFFLWRTNPDNEMTVAIVVGSIGLILAGVVIRRLWRSRSRLEERARMDSYRGICEETPLIRLESLVCRCIGPRPPGMTYGCWLCGAEEQCGEIELLAEAIDLHQRWRFDPEPLDESQRKRLRELSHTIELTLQRRLSEEAKRER